MSILRETFVHILCDVCQKKYPKPRGNSSQTRFDAARDGWHIKVAGTGNGYLDICPECVGVDSAPFCALKMRTVEEYCCTVKARIDTYRPLCTCGWVGEKTKDFALAERQWTLHYEMARA